MKFSDIIGQNDVKRFLRRNVDSQRIAHAQLFEGQSGYGSLALALAYVQYINCPDKKDGDSCGICPSCHKISILQHPDLHFVFPVNRTDKAVNLSKNAPPTSDNFIELWREIFLSGIAPGYMDAGEWFDFIGLNSKTLQPIINKKEADSIINRLILKPLDSKYVSIIIWLPEKMNEAAANTLLKQFEEPIANALFIFVTQDSSKIIKTILSRTQSITVPPIDRTSLTEYIYTHFPEHTDIGTITKVSNGSITTALKNIKQEEGDPDESFEMFKILMRYCFQNKHLDLLDWVDSFDKLNKEQLDNFFSVAVETLRYSYMENIGLPQLNLSYRSKKDFIIKFYPFISSENIEKLIHEFQEASFHLSRSGHLKIVMTHFALSVTKLINAKK